MRVVGSHGALVLITILLACSGGTDRRFVTPPLNGAPARTMTIAGRVDPRAELKLQVEYQTTAKSCEMTVDSFAGVHSPRIYQHELAVQRTGDRYSATVPLDLVNEPACAWAPFSINYTVLVDGEPHMRPLAPTPLVWFHDGAATSIRPFAVTCAPVRDVLGHGLECNQPGGDYLLSLTPERLNADFVLRATK